MKTIRVVAAVIRATNENNEPIIFATQRGYGELKGGWEFPGGKIEGTYVHDNDDDNDGPGRWIPSETPEQALVREIREELDTEIEVGELIYTIEYTYPTFHLSMDCFWCELRSDHFVLLEHEAAKWLTKNELQSVPWLPADLELIDLIKERL